LKPQSAIALVCLSTACLSPLAYAMPANGIAVIGNTLAEAKSNYAAATNLPRVDCDAVGGGQWVCANFRNPTRADVSDTPSEPVTPPTNPPPNPDPQPEPNPPSSNRVAVIGATLAEARQRYSAATNLPRVDCDRLSDGRWICASFKHRIQIQHHHPIQIRTQHHRPIQIPIRLHPRCGLP